MCPLIGHLCFVAYETFMQYVDIKQGYVSFNRTFMFYGLLNISEHRPPSRRTPGEAPRVFGDVANIIIYNTYK